MACPRHAPPDRVPGPAWPERPRERRGGESPELLRCSGRGRGRCAAARLAQGAAGPLPPRLGARALRKALGEVAARPPKTQDSARSDKGPASRRTSLRMSSPKARHSGSEWRRGARRPSAGMSSLGRPGRDQVHGPPARWPSVRGSHARCLPRVAPPRDSETAVRCPLRAALRRVRAQARPGPASACFLHPWHEASCPMCCALPGPPALRLVPLRTEVAASRCGPR